MTRPTALTLRAQAELPAILPFEPVPGLQLVAAAGDGADTKPVRFTMTAYTGGVMSPSGFGEPIVVDLAGVKTRAEQLPILRDHDRSKVLGHSEGLEVTAQRLLVKGVLSGGNAHVDEVVAAARNGFPWGASIGCTIQKLEFVQAGQKAKVNGRVFDGPIYVARQVEIYEVTVLAVAADPNSKTKVAATAAASQEFAMSFAQWLKSQGKVEANLSAGDLATLRAEYDQGLAAGTIKAEPATPPTPPTPTKPGSAGEPATLQAELEERRRTLAAEARRVAKIGELTKGHPTIEAKAIEEGWNTERVELEVLRAGRPTNVPGAIVRGGEQPTGQVLEAAVCMAAGLGHIEKHFTPQTLEAAHRGYRGVIGIQELLMVAAQANGYSGPQLGVRSDLQGVLAAAMPAHGMQAEFSTLSLPGILSNVANKFLLAGFETVEQTWRLIARIKAVKDFKQNSSYRLTGDLTYQEVGPTGELKHGTVGEQSFTNQAKTYGRLFGITRQDIINDDLGALSDVPKMIGRGGALKLNLVIWTEFMDNAAFFASGNDNYAEGAGTALGHAAFSQAEALFLNQTDPDGNPIAVQAATLLVPNALKATAEELMMSSEVRDTTASKKAGTTNIHRGKAKVAASSYLSNAGITGYSALAWYLLANPDDLAAIEVCFLNGQQNPTVETAQADFNMLGIQMRGYHDFGASKQETRAAVKMKGEA